MSLKNNKSIDFLGVGSMKSGSTWVSKCLEEHPQVQFSSESSVKELQYFSSNNPETKIIHGPSNYNRGIKWYFSQFPPAHSGLLRGEYSNSYFNDKLAPSRIKDTFPSVKLILTLRNPVFMSYSLYWWLKAGLKNPLGKKTYKEAFEKYSWFRDKGLYSGYLRRYYKIFNSSNIHIIFFQDIVDKPKDVATDLFAYLNLEDTSFVPKIVNRKVRGSITKRSSFISRLLKYPAEVFRKSSPNLYWDITTNRYVYNLYKKINNKRVDYPKISVQDKDMAVNYYKNDITKVESLLKKDLSSWYKI